MIPNKVLYVCSGKGGVGKSTISVNLAYALGEQGIKTGLLDADLYGPSIPLMVSALDYTPPIFYNFIINPGTYGKVKINSLGFFSSPSEGGFWSNKYMEGAFQQLLFDSNWGDTEILVVDMPPGAGNIHTHLFTKMKGKAIIVTTPQDLSYIDAKRGIETLNRLGIDIGGIVENMSYYSCECGVNKKIFSGDTKKNLCEPYSLNLLLELPINSKISETNNKGVPFVLENNMSAEAQKITNLAKTLFDNYSKIKSVRPTN